METCAFGSDMTAEEKQAIIRHRARALLQECALVIVTGDDRTGLLTRVMKFLKDTEAE